MKGHGEKKTRKDEQTIAALLACPTIATAARKVGISETTLWRWLQDPEFQSQYRKARQHAVQHSIGALQRATTAAVETLERNLTCKTPTVEVQAARVILEQAIKAAELDDLIARVEEIERALETKQNTNGSGG